MTESTLRNNDMLEAEQSYKFDDILFIVKPIFKKESKEALTTILLNLMQSEVETN